VGVIGVSFDGTDAVLLQEDGSTTRVPAAEWRASTAETEAGGSPPSMSWTRAELVAYAADTGVEHDADATKAEVLAAIEGR